MPMAVKPITPTPFTEWCAEKRHEADQLTLNHLPADQYFAALDEGNEAIDRIQAALSRKVVVRAA